MSVVLAVCSLKTHDEGSPGLAPAMTHQAWASWEQPLRKCELGLGKHGWVLPWACLPSPTKSAQVSPTQPGGTTNALAVGNSDAEELSGAWRSWAHSSAKWLYEEIKLRLLLCEVPTGLWPVVAAAMLMIMAANGHMTLGIRVNLCRTSRTRASATKDKN